MAKSQAKLPAKVKAKLSPAKRKQIAAHQAKRRRNAQKRAGSKRASSKRPRRRNGVEGAAALYEKFHQAPAEKVTTKTLATHKHAVLADLGRLAELFVKVDTGDTRKLVFAEQGAGVVRLAASEDGGQLYFIGGDQKLDLAKLGQAGNLPKDHLAIGECTAIAYETAKGFHDFKPSLYVHKFGEGGHERPALGYDVRNKRLYLVGGSYQVKREGIVH
jgi:hypothetical protein